jgi:16S rRNA (guanine966-N2)-methyltransferase
LFAGTGALGFEAASRGAKQVVMIERDGQLIQQLREQIRQLDTNDIITEQCDALTWLRATNKSFDIVFLDPPFGQGLIEKSCDVLKTKGCLRVGGMIYIESGQPATQPAGWCVKKQTTAGQVQCMLLTSELADEIS